MNRHSSFFVKRNPSVPLRLGLALVAIVMSAVAAFVLLTGVLNPAKAAASYHTIALPTAYPWGIGFDTKGNAWVAEPGCDPHPFVCSATHTGSIALVNTASFSVTKNFTEPSGRGFSSPFFPVADASGNIWFAEPNANAIGELIPSLHNSTASTWKQWSVPTQNAAPFKVAFDERGLLWFTEPQANQIGSFNTTTHAFTETGTPSANSTPYGITGPDAKGEMWFTENNAAVARVASFVPPTTGKLNKTMINEYLTVNPGPGTTVHLITLDHNGHAWWTQGFDGRIGSITISQAVKGTSKGVREYSTPGCSGCNAHVSGIAVDNAGVVWYDDSLRNVVGSYNPATNSFSTPISIANGGHPHDGLGVASNNTVFFVEEFGQKLGQIPQATANHHKK